MKNIFALGIVSVLAFSLLAGCSGQKAGTPDAGDAARKPVINFEGVVTAAEDGTLTLDGRRTVLISGSTSAAAPDGSAADQGRVPAWAKDAAAWALQNGLISENDLTNDASVSEYVFTRAWRAIN